MFKKPKHASFPDYMETLNRAQKSELCRKSGLNRQYVWFLATAQRMAGIAAIVALMKADKNISVELMRPDLFPEHNE